MNISVAIPTYNSSAFIARTLDSVLAQTEHPHEILVVDDGSTDATVELLRSYGSRIKLAVQTNGGTASARNHLCRLATGDAIAFLDHDDLWHPDCLKTHAESLNGFPEAVVSFVGHETFQGYAGYQWEQSPRWSGAPSELIGASDFIVRYHTGIGLFMSMSFSCVRRSALDQIGDQPFRVDVSGADDFYLFNRVPIIGPVVFNSKRLAAYRITTQAQSVNRLKGAGLAIRAVEALAPLYRSNGSRQLRRAFAWASSVQRREYGRILMGGERVAEAREQFMKSVNDHRSAISMVKSLALFGSTYLPPRLQPKWIPPLQTPQFQ